VANLLLAGCQRTREVSVRISIGASRWRIVRQLLIESLLLALVAGVIGLALSTVGIRLFDAATRTSEAVLIEFTMDGRVLRTGGHLPRHRRAVRLAPVFAYRRPTSTKSRRAGAQMAARASGVGRPRSSWVSWRDADAPGGRRFMMRNFRCMARPRSTRPD
jgi:hypothetical protein